MALTRLNQFDDGTTLTEAELEGEFDNIYSNGTDVAFPLTKNVSAGGFRVDDLGKGAVSQPGLNFTGDTNTGFMSSAADVAEIAAGGNEVAQFTGSTTAVNYVDIAAAATGVAPILRAEGDDANVGLDLTTKADGAIRFNGMAFAGHLWGLTLSNNATDATNDIDIAVGEAISDDAAASSKHGMALTSALIKRLDAAWAVGTNAGMLDTGAIANGTYHIFLIKRTDTGVVDILASTSASSPTMPTGYTKKRRIGSILREAAAIVAFTQDGDYFRRDAGILDIDATNPGTAAVTRTLSVPTGIRVFALFNARLASTTVVSTGYFSDLDANDEAVSQTAAPLSHLGTTDGNVAYVANTFSIRTNTSAQIRSRVIASDANTILRMATLGWTDSRGRHA